MCNKQPLPLHQHQQQQHQLVILIKFASVFNTLHCLLLLYLTQHCLLQQPRAFASGATIPMCMCYPARPCTLLVRQHGPNAGRWFYSCALHRCHAFYWAGSTIHYYIMSFIFIHYIKIVVVVSILYSLRAFCFLICSAVILSFVFIVLRCCVRF